MSDVIECGSENTVCVCRLEKDHPLPHQCGECRIDWDDEGHEWLRVEAFMRVFGSKDEERPLQMRYLNKDVWGVEVPGFGFLILTRADDKPNSDRAVLSQGLGQNVERPLTRTTHEITCELLHKEDRLCVVIKREQS